MTPSQIEKQSQEWLEWFQITLTWDKEKPEDYISPSKRPWWALSSQREIKEEKERTGNE